jgi:hypothetical protein
VYQLLLLLEQGEQPQHLLVALVLILYFQQLPLLAEGTAAVITERTGAEQQAALVAAALAMDPLEELETHHQLHQVKETSEAME